MDGVEVDYTRDTETDANFPDVKQAVMNMVMMEYGLDNVLRIKILH